MALHYIEVVQYDFPVHGCTQELKSTVTCFLGALFGMLDTETDVRLTSDIHDTLNSMLQSLAANNLTHWLGLCRDVLSASKSSKGGNGGDAQKRETEEGEILILDEHFVVRCSLENLDSTIRQYNLECLMSTRQIMKRLRPSVFEGIKTWHCKLFK